jgi:hypothetical protein
LLVGDEYGAQMSCKLLSLKKLMDECKHTRTFASLQQEWKEPSFFFCANNQPPCIVVLGGFGSRG